MSFTTNSSGMSLQQVCAVFEELAPNYLADTWDNTGLLIQPTRLHQGLDLIQSIMVTNDLSEAVMQEALQKRVQLIYSYHPPIFSSFKRLRQSHWKERLALNCAENGIALYSPHTAMDAVFGGVNDWLLSPYEKSEIRSLQAPSQLPAQWYMVNLFSSHDNCMKALKGALAEETSIQISSDCAYIVVPAAKITFLKHVLRAVLGREDMYEIRPVVSSVSEHGYGRWARLSRPYSIQDLVHATKQLLGVEHLMLALAVGHHLGTPVQEVSVCAGSGGSLLLKHGQGDGMRPQVYLSGEMRHHEVLDCVHQGISVILARHSTSERGYLRILKDKLHVLFQKAVEKKVASGGAGGDAIPNILISAADLEPLDIV